MPLDIPENEAFIGNLVWDLPKCKPYAKIFLQQRKSDFSSPGLKRQDKLKKPR